MVHHPQPDDVVRGHSEHQPVHGQPQELVGDGPAAHAQVPEQEFWVFVVTVHVVFAAVHVGPTVAVQRRGYADQGVPHEAGGHERLHDGLDGQPVAHAVHGQREQGRQGRRRQHGSGLEIQSGVYYVS